MSRHPRYPLFAALLVLGFAFGAPLAADGGVATAKLLALREVPSVNAPGHGAFEGTINDNDTQVDWELTYTAMEGAVTQAHLHFAQAGVNGGIIIFLCSNLGNGPAGTPACPADDGHLTGSFTGDDIQTVAGQGVAPGEIFGVLRGIRTGNVYANVHTDRFPGGEIRGQLRFTPSE